MSDLTRRRFTASALTASLAALAVGGFAGSARADTRLRFFWWGNPERNKRTYEVVDLYQKQNSGITVDPETLGWDDYWPKMATQAAGKNLADVIQMDYRYLFEYARRGQIAPLDDFMGKELDLSHFNPKFLDSGKVDGKLYAVPWTSNSAACYYDADKLSELGMEPLKADWTWDDLKAICQNVKKAGIKNYWGVADKAPWEPMMEFFMRQRGKGLYDDEGRIGYDEADVADYFGLWEGLRQDGLVPPADITVQDTTLQKMPLTLGNALVDFAHSNQLVALQAMNQHQLGMNMLPNLPGGQPGQYMKPSMLISVSQNSDVKPAGAAFTNFLATSMDAAKVLRVERGVPGDEQVRDALITDADPIEKKMLDYLATVSHNVGPLPPPPPKGAGEIEKLLLRFYPRLAFGQMGVQDGAKEFYSNAQAILKRG
jgi:multiple sugar transport system substrate-binding protein